MEFLVPGGEEGWPGGVRQQYSVAQGLIEGTIRDVKRLPSLQASLAALPCCICTVAPPVSIYRFYYHQHMIGSVHARVGLHDALCCTRLQ